MTRYPSTWKLADLFVYVNCGECQAGVKNEDGKEIWVPARPLGWCSLQNRFRSAWLVFTGRADVLLWPYQ